MRDALLYVALCCGEIACVGLACAWLAFPAAVEWAQAWHVFKPWLFSSIVGGPLAAVWVADLIFTHLD